MNESFIAGGKTDMVAMATPLFADPEYVQKAYEGRAEDIVPCVRCHNCHGISRTTGPWIDTCSVNPKWGLSETKKNSIRPPAMVKKVAVIGGGPAGGKEMVPASHIGPHNMENQIDLYQNHENIRYELETIPTKISKGKVAYRDASGSEKSVEADSVVIYAGLKPKMEEALNFSGTAGQVMLLGDCTGNAGTIQKTIRSAYFIASQV